MTVESHGGVLDSVRNLSNGEVLITFATNQLPRGLEDSLNFRLSYVKPRRKLNGQSTQPQVLRVRLRGPFRSRTIPQLMEGRDVVATVRTVAIKTLASLDYAYSSSPCRSRKKWAFVLRPLAR